MGQAGALNFSVDYGRHDPRTERYGDFFWAVGLSDGREVMLHADRLEVSEAGVLTAWCNARKGHDEHEETPSLPTLILAPGTWVHAYAASAIDSHPVAVDHLDSPEKA